MDELSDLMRAATAAPPPTRIEMNTLIAKEQRRSRRNWTASVTGIGVALAGILVIPAVLGGAGSKGIPVPIVEPLTAPPVELCAPLTQRPGPGTPWPPMQSYDTTRERPTEPPTRAVPRLTSALREALRATLPTGVRVEPVQPGCTDPQFAYHPSYRRYDLMARIERGDEFRMLVIRVMPTGVDDDWSLSGDR